MNTTRLPAQPDERLLPELEPSPDALIGGPELLDDDEAAATASYLEWCMFKQPDVSVFNLPLYYQLRQRPYHQPEFDLENAHYDLFEGLGSVDFA